MKDSHRTLRTAMLVHGILDLLGAIILLVYPKIITIAQPSLSINYYAERVVAGALFAVGGTSIYAWTFNTRQRFVDLLVLKAIWSCTVVLGVMVTFLERPDLVGVPTIITLLIFVLGAGIWTGYLFSYTKY